MRVSILSLILLPVFCPAADYQVQGNIRYGSHPEAVLDLLQPRAPALQKRPGAILLVDDRAQMETYATPFIKADFVVANVEHRSRAIPGEAVSDIGDALTWLQDHADQYKVDRRRVIVVGAAKSGSLALLLASSAPAGSVAAVIRFAGIADTSDTLPSKGPPVLTIHADAGDIWPQIFKWLKKRKITS